MLQSIQPSPRAAARACMVGKLMEANGFRPGWLPSLSSPSGVPWNFPTWNWVSSAPWWRNAGCSSKPGAGSGLTHSAFLPACSPAGTAPAR